MLLYIVAIKPNCLYRRRVAQYRNKAGEQEISYLGLHI